MDNNLLRVGETITFPQYSLVGVIKSIEHISYTRRRIELVGPAGNEISLLLEEELPVIEVLDGL